MTTKPGYYAGRHHGGFDLIRSSQQADVGGNTVRRVVLVSLAIAANPSNETWIGQRKLREQLHLGERAVREAMGWLEARGLIARTKRYAGENKRQNDLVRLELPAPEAASTDALDALGAGSSDPLPAPEAEATRPSDRSHPPDGLDITAIEQPMNSHSGDEFDSFWSSYPKKAQKQKARAEFEKARERADPATIMAAAKNYAATVTNTEDRYITNPANWLRDDQWTDYQPDPAAERAKDRDREETKVRRARARGIVPIDREDYQHLTDEETAALDRATEAERTRHEAEMAALNSYDQPQVEQAEGTRNGRTGL